MKKYVMLVFLMGCVAVGCGAPTEAEMDKIQSPHVKMLAHNQIAGTISRGRVVVDFYANWCGPCRRFMPIFMEVADDMRGQLTFAKVKLEERGGPWKDYNISTIPSIILFENGKEVKRHGSFPDAASFKDFLNN